MNRRQRKQPTSPAQHPPPWFWTRNHIVRTASRAALPRERGRQVPQETENLSLRAFVGKGADDGLDLSFAARGVSSRMVARTRLSGSRAARRLLRAD